MSSPEHEPILIHTIPGPLPPVPESLIRLRPEEKSIRFEREGQAGVDASGLDAEFYEQLTTDNQQGEQS